MSTLHSWRKGFTAIMEWTPVDKGLVILMMAIPLYAQYLVWGMFTLNAPFRNEVINTEHLTSVMAMQAALIIVGVALSLVGLVLRKRHCDSMWFQHATLQFYCISLVMLSYGIGTVSFPVGVVLLGATIFGLILLDRTAVWWALATAVLLLTALTMAAMMGHIPYAPSKPAILSHDAQIFWMLSELYFAAPFIVLMTLIADQTLLWWRDREQRIRLLSETDNLTGLANRHCLFANASAMLENREATLCVILTDLDRFKRINDVHGHAMGDQALIASAQALTTCLRSDDVVGRYGGEEFLILLANRSTEEALAVAERCRLAIAAVELKTADGQALPITASFGVTQMSAGQEPLDHAIQRADEALYQAKHNGRNRVECVLLNTGIVAQHALTQHS